MKIFIINNDKTKDKAIKKILITIMFKNLKKSKNNNNHEKKNIERKRDKCWKRAAGWNQ